MLCRLFLALALLFGTPLAASANTLAEAMAACESFVATEAIPDTVDTEFTLMGDFDYATMDTELGPVLLTFAKDYGLNATTYCDLTGADLRDETGPISVTWGQALPLVQAFLNARAADGAGKVLPMLTDELMLAACRDDGGYFITGQALLLGARTDGIEPDGFPLILRVSQWTGNAAKPCDF